jgi:hypothetical protein
MIEINFTLYPILFIKFFDEVFLVDKKWSTLNFFKFVLRGKNDGTKQLYLIRHLLGTI